ncbi:MAG TPA: phosphatidate cytidylyltransferase [Verrucomicrobiae bacterium]|nr:phosphatidate cytidylyltransferase [Verrucomicrobiae bacterium]
MNGPAATVVATTNGTNPRGGFRWRLVSSLVLWGIMLAVVFCLPPSGLYLFMNVVIARAVWEFYAICEAKGLRAYKVWGVIGAVALISGSWFVFGMDAYRRPADFPALSYDFDIFILLVFAVGVFIRQFPQKLNPQGIETMAVTLFGLIYVAWLSNFITRVNFATSNGRFWVMYLVVVTKFTDIGAYLVGSALGRHKMIPRISPKKSWEGTVGGLVFAVGGSLLCYFSVTPQLAADGMRLEHALILGVLLGAAAVIGDLAESLIKREANVKDSSTWLPGHGGALDLIDSLLFTAPLLYVYMRLVLR